MRSGQLVNVTGLIFSTPWTVMVSVPRPSIWAPMACSISPNTTTSGSAAQFSRTDSPVAVTAARSTLMVAPTLTGSNRMRPPARRPPGASAMT